jgi:hypothetical protein
MPSGRADLKTRLSDNPGDQTYPDRAYMPSLHEPAVVVELRVNGKVWAACSRSGASSPRRRCPWPGIRTCWPGCSRDQEQIRPR